MTTQLTDPDTPATDASSARPGPARRGFVKAFPGQGRGHLGCAVVAAGTVDGVPARLALTVDRHVTVDVRYQPSAGAFTVNINGGTTLGQELARTAETAARAAAEVHHLTGNIVGTLRMPPVGDGGSDVHTAAVHAAVNAVADAAEVAASSAVHAAALRACSRPLVALPAAAGVHVHDTRTGVPLSSWETFPRFYVVYLHQVAGPGGVDTFALTEAGDLAQVPTAGEPGDASQVAAWLHAASAGGGLSPVRHILEDLHAAGHLGSVAVVGGHGPTDPVALLLPPEHSSLLAAQRAQVRIAAALKDQFGVVGTGAPWRATTSRLAFA